MAPTISISVDCVAIRIHAPTNAPTALAITNCVFRTNPNNCAAINRPSINEPQYTANTTVATRAPSLASPAYVEVHPAMLASFPDWQNNSMPISSTPGYFTTCPTSRHEKLCDSTAAGNSIDRNPAAHSPAIPAQIHNSCEIVKCPAITAANSGMHSAPTP